MTVGEVVSGVETVLSTQRLTIQPGSGTLQYTIHNLYIPKFSTCEVYRTTSGGTDILLLTTSESLLSYIFHCTNSSYITVKNIGAASISLGYDGVIAKE